MTTLAPSAAEKLSSDRTSVPSSRRRLRLAWLTTEYPKVSHTFIRREILELERRGHSVLRLAIRNPGSAVVDAADRDELAKTIHCLDCSVARLIATTLITIVAHPIRWLKSFAYAVRLGRRSERGIIRHLAYLIEATWLLHTLAQHRIEHLHVHFGTNAATVAMIARMLGGPPFSFTVHGPDEFDAPRGFALREKAASANAVIAISDFCSAQMRRWADPAHWSRIHVVRCTVDAAFFTHARPVDPACATLLCVGRLTPQKGQLLLLDAVRRLLDEGEECNLVLAGDGEMRQEIERQIIDRELQNRVTITGWIDEDRVRRHLQNCRVLVQPSFAEGLPVVMMEAMAMARPVIATNIAGVAELVSHQETGWLIAAGNCEALLDAMRDALHSPTSQLNDMGLAGQNRVRQQHLVTTEVARLESILLNAGSSREEC